jgi:hypothetical protein
MTSWETTGGSGAPRSDRGVVVEKAAIDPGLPIFSVSTLVVRAMCVLAASRLATWRQQYGSWPSHHHQSGRIIDAPAWVRTAGLQWFHRLLQEPRRLWKRYRINNRKFVLRIALQLTGITHYSL